MLHEMYKILLEKYKPRKWWPTTAKGKLKPEYSGGPSDEKEMFEVIIGAILTQNTSWKNVEKAIIKLNKENLIDIEKIYSIDIEKLKELIRPAGYYNQKAERLKIIAEFLKNRTIKDLKKLKITELRELLLSVKGIGPETADSIILYAFNKPIFAIDTYTKRIFSRLGILEESASYDEWQSYFHEQLEPSTKLFQEYHALIVEHAKQFCKKKANYDNCFLECPRNQSTS